MRVSHYYFSRYALMTVAEGVVGGRGSLFPPQVRKFLPQSEFGLTSSSLKKSQILQIQPLRITTHQPISNLSLRSLSTPIAMVQHVLLRTARTIFTAMRPRPSPQCLSKCTPCRAP